MRPWRAPLRGEAAAACLVAAEELGELLRARQPSSPDLASGAAASALVFTYLHRALPTRGWDEHAVAELDRAIDLLGAFDPRPDLFSGVAGVAWASDHIVNALFPGEAADEDPNEPVDAFLLDLLDRDRWDGDLDLLGGLAGIAVYALARRERASARRMLARVVDHLAARAEQRPEGVAWRSRPLLASDEEAARMPGGYFDLGVAHGVPGIMAVLARLDAADIERARVRQMLEGAAAWLMSQRLPDGAGGSFAAVAAPEGTGAPAALAWCRGDPGAATALGQAAVVLGDDGLRDEARAILLRSTTRDLRWSEPGLCHGAAGLGLIYARALQGTGEERFASAAARWFEEALRMRSPGQGFGGYTRRYGDAWLPAEDLLSGVPGIALALLAASTDVDPSWDALLLLEPIES